MDSLSQMALGAAVAEASLGRKIGRPALLLGAVLGTVPDMDVLIHYADAVDSFTRHRGFSHSLFVLSLLSLPLSQLCRRVLDKQGKASAGRWLLGVWAVLVTHTLLDGFTVYGTQWFWPLPVLPVAISSIFIIDPMYTVPLVIGVLCALRWRDVRGARANAIGLILAQSWLLVMLVLQQVVRVDAIAQLDEQGVQASDVLVLPLPLGVMWRILAIEDDDVLEAWVSFADGEDSIRFDRMRRGLDQLGALNQYPPVERLRWFTRDFLALRESDNVAVLSDLRMGSATNPVFSFEIAERDGEDFAPILTRDRLIYACPPELLQLARRAVNASPPMPVPSVPGAFLSRDPDTRPEALTFPDQVRCG